MHNEYLPYELALAINEMGFNESCYAVYRKIKSVWNCEDYTIQLFTFESSVHVRNLIESDKKSHTHISIPAPTFHQAARFLYVKTNGIVDIKIKGSETNKIINTKFKKAISKL